MLGFSVDVYELAENVSAADLEAVRARSSMTGWQTRFGSIADLYRPCSQVAGQDAARISEIR